MAESEHLRILKEGVASWNRWRQEHADVQPDLHDISLVALDLRSANLAGANLNGANLSKANLAGANFAEADLRGADLRGADLSKANLTGVNFSQSTIDNFTLYRDVQGCDIGVNGLYSPLTDSAALLRIDPPGNSMQGANADAVIESLRHARKLHTFSLLLAGIAMLFIVIKPKTITLPYLAGSFKFDDLSYSFLATFLSTVLLSQVSSFIDSALQGAHYLNDRRSAMLVGHFPWLLSKYESEPANRRQSKVMRFFLVFHPVVYLYFFMKWDVLFKRKIFGRCMNNQLIIIKLHTKTSQSGFKHLLSICISVWCSSNVNSRKNNGPLCPKLKCIFFQLNTTTGNIKVKFFTHGLRMQRNSQCSTKAWKGEPFSPCIMLFHRK